MMIGIMHDVIPSSLQVSSWGGSVTNSGKLFVGR